MKKDFAKIILTSSGTQVLFYVEPDGNDFVLNQITTTDVGAINIKCNFTKQSSEENEKDAYKCLNLITQKTADKIEKRLTKLLERAL